MRRSSKSSSSTSLSAVFFGLGVQGSRTRREATTDGVRAGRVFCGVGDFSSFICRNDSSRRVGGEVDEGESGAGEVLGVEVEIDKDFEMDRDGELEGELEEDLAGPGGIGDLLRDLKANPDGDGVRDVVCGDCDGEGESDGVEEPEVLRLATRDDGCGEMSIRSIDSERRAFRFLFVFVLGVLKSFPGVERFKGEDLYGTFDVEATGVLGSTNGGDGDLSEIISTTP